MTYKHDGDKYEVTVGEPRKVYQRETGPRGSYIEDADWWARSAITRCCASMPCRETASPALSVVARPAAASAAATRRRRVVNHP